MIIDTSYFLNKSVFIPNAVAQPSIGSNAPTSVAQLQAEIDHREQEVLISALGITQYTELMAQFAVGGAWTGGALQKWKDLVDGKSYDGKRWNGLRQTIGTKKVSAIAFYVYFHYLKDDFSMYSTTGIQVANAQNAERQIPNHKQVEAWNEFANRWNGTITRSRNYSFFNNWNGMGMQWLGGANRNDVTLQEFLNDNTATYDNSFFEYKGIINAYNL